MKEPGLLEYRFQKATIWDRVKVACFIQLHCPHLCTRTVQYVTIDNNTMIMFSAVYRWKEEKKKPEEVGKKLR